jgi:hypothetical protein
MKFRIAAVVEVRCERFIEADDFNDAEKQAKNMSGEEWLSYAVGPELIDITDVYHDPEEPLTLEKMVSPNMKKIHKAAFDYCHYGQPDHLTRNYVDESDRIEAAFVEGVNWQRNECLCKPISYHPNHEGTVPLNVLKSEL